ncbi:MarR family winged helix-turn-helix transcriptional regulator [Arthrobacter sp. GCM10027362]|uniref:MarR family winged helix-turn-helix transcriptional regulator n=1 Tax=Arthrobacter sp. GCM10027362 TaxID=3273379 RepID=UPI00363DB9AB
MVGTAARIAAALERLDRAQRMLLQQAATRHGLSALTVRILLLLHAAPGRMLPSGLAAELGVTRATVSDAVATLRSRGLVAAAADPADRRRSNLALTGAGTLLAGELAHWNVPLEEHLAALPPAEQGHLLAGLLGMIAGLQRDGLVPAQRMCVNCRFFHRDTAPGTAAPHFCDLLQQPLAPAALQLDCPEHEARRESA